MELHMSFLWPLGYLCTDNKGECSGLSSVEKTVASLNTHYIQDVIFFGHKTIYKCVAIYY